MLSQEAIAAFKKTGVECADRSTANGEAVLDAYERIERGPDGQLELVLFPKEAQELQAVVGVLNQFKLPSTTIAGRTGLVEAQRAQGVGISTVRMNAPLAFTLRDGTRHTFSARQDNVPYAMQLEIWRDELADAMKGAPASALINATLHVQAGLAIDAINGRPSTTDEPGGYPGLLQAIGRKVPIVMASTPTATIGACVANGSAGANALRYGTAADMAVEVEAVLGTGDTQHYSNGQTPKRSPDMDEPLIRSDRFSHGDSAIGSQGALSIITEVTVITHAVPQEQVITLFPIQSCAEAQYVLEQSRNYFAGDGEAIELFELIKGDTLVRAKQHCQKRTQTEDGAPYYVIMQLTSDQKQLESELFPDHSVFFEKMAMFFMEYLSMLDGSGLMFPDAQGVDYDSNPHRLIAIREAASEKSHGQPKRAYDVVLPLKRLDSFITQLETIAQQRYPHLQLDVFGHAGVGALHIHFIGDVSDCAKALDNDVFDLVQLLNGSPWAEHGVGSKWGDEWHKRTPLAIQDSMLVIKKKNDPQNVIGSYVFGFDKLLQKKSLRCNGDIKT